jgi:hypothetical protein
MTVVVYIIGALLVIAGGAFISMGVPIVRLEIGWSEIIGGAVAGSAGFVILAIGVVLTRLQGLQRILLGLNSAAVLRTALEEQPSAWAAEPDETPLFAPHPLAPVVARQAAPERPAPFAAPDLHPAHEVEPEPSLVEAPLHVEVQPFDHHEAPQPIEHEPAAFALDEGAPALAASEDHAPAVQPVEALVPPVVADVPDDIEPPAFPPPPAPPPELTRSRPNFLAAFLARRNAAAERPTIRGDGQSSIEPLMAPLPEPDARPAPPPRTSIDLSSGWDEAEVPPVESHPLRGSHDPLGKAPREHQPEEAAVVDAPHEHEPFHDDEQRRRDDEAVLRGLRYDEEPASEPESPAEPEPAAEAAPAAEDEVPEPVVVGRYNAGSASYVMYSNGMIEVETDSGTHQFASMQDLKAFIERRDSAPV